MFCSRHTFFLWPYMVSRGALLTADDAPVLQCVIGYVTSLYLVMGTEENIHINFYSSGSSGWVKGAEKHEIYAATFGGHLFYD